MFANLKKKIEEEVGDLGRLTSPINLAGALGDRRVGGSTQGTNTPSNLGSRQSSVASLIGLDMTPDRGGSRLLTPSSASHQQREPSASNIEEVQLLKRQNADLKSKLEALKKSYEEKLQNQEADFAWKYNMKDDELVHVKSDRDRLKDQMKNAETGWQDKYMRVATELETLEGLSKQENAKVKHLLLNTQNDLQVAMRRVAELESDSKNRRDRETANLMHFTNSDYDSTAANGSEMQTISLEDSPQDSPYKAKIQELEEKKQQLEVALEQAKHTAGDVLEKRMNEMAADLTRKEMDNAALTSELAELRLQMEEMKRVNETKLTENDNRMAEASKVEASLDSLKQMYEARSAELQKSQDETSKLQSQIVKYLKEIEQKASEVTTVKALLDEANRNKDSLQDELIKLSQKCDSTENEVSNLQEQLSKLELSTADSGSRESTLRSATEEQSRKLESLAAELAAKESSLEASSVKHQQIYQELQTVIQERDSTRQSLVKAENELKTTQESVKRLQLDNVSAAANWESQVNSLKQRLESLMGETGQLKEQAEVSSHIEHELLAYQQEVNSLRSDLVASFPQYFEDIGAGGQLPGDLASIRKRVVHQIAAQKNLEDEMRKIKEDTAMEVRNIQERTENLVSQTLEELTATKRVADEKTKELASLSQQLESARNDNQKLQAVQSERNELKRLFSEKSTECTSLMNKLEETQNKNEKLNEDILKLNEAKLQLEAEAKDAQRLKNQFDGGMEELSALKQRLDALTAEASQKSKTIQELQEASKSKDVMVEKLKEENTSLVSRLEAEAAASIGHADEVSSLRNQLREAEIRLKALALEVDTQKSELEAAGKKLDSANKKASASQKQLTETMDQLRHRIADLEKQAKEREELTKSVTAEANELREQNSVLNSKIGETSAIDAQKSEEIRLLETKIVDLQQECTEVSKQSTKYKDELDVKESLLKAMEGKLQMERHEDLQKLEESESTIKSLREDLVKHEAMIEKANDSVLSLRRDIDRLNQQISDSKTLVTTLQDEKDSMETQLDELSVLKSLAEEEAKTASDRSTELYNEVTDLKKSLRTSRQQLSEMKKSLTKEPKPEPSPVPASSSGNHRISVSGMEEVSLRDTSLQDPSVPFSEVNFLYLRSVLFKYLTASDPQVAANLIRVVATLLELKPEEEKLLKDSHSNHSRWFNSFIKK